MFTLPAKFTKTVFAFCIVFLVFFSVLGYAPKAHAQNGVPINTLFNFHNIQQQLKDFVLKGLATTVARMILQQLTQSIVSWINNGFKGSPSFITNPQGFFLDAADQVTGLFLAQYGGPLSNLCSPFSLDIRIALALGVSQTSQSRYTCTLGSIINNAQNASISINGQTVAGGSLAGFVGGDFSQGGWPAFVSMTTEPQNNIYGSYLQAQSDLQLQIGLKKNSINADLSLGNGFLSYQNCTTLQTVDGDVADDVSAAEQKYAGNSSVSKVTDAEGTIEYQSCETDTPGSAISGLAQKTLGAPIDQLNLTNDINQIFSAVMGQLISSVLSSGLHQYNSGSNPSFNSYTPSDLPSSSTFDAQKQSLITEMAPYTQNASQYQTYYTQAVQAIDTIQSAYASTRSCITTKLADPNSTLTDPQKKLANSDVSDIDTAVTTKIQPLLLQYQTSLTDANNRVSYLGTLNSSVSTIQTQDDIVTITNNLQSAPITSTADLSTAQADVATAQASVQTLQTSLNKDQSDCDNNFPVVIQVKGAI